MANNFPWTKAEDDMLLWFIHHDRNGKTFSRVRPPIDVVTDLNADTLTREITWKTYTIRSIFNRLAGGDLLRRYNEECGTIADEARVIDQELQPFREFICATRERYISDPGYLPPTRNVGSVSGAALLTLEPVVGAEGPRHLDRHRVRRSKERRERRRVAHLPWYSS